jgi:hypothetical protein
LYAKGEVKIIVPIYIDDITLASKSNAAIDKTVKELSQHFKLCDLGPTKFLLGVEITRNHPNHTIALSRCQYIVDMLEKYGMTDCNPVKTPFPPELVLSKDMCPKTDAEKLYFTVPHLS